MEDVGCVLACGGPCGSPYYHTVRVPLYSTCCVAPLLDVPLALLSAAGIAAASAITIGGD